MTKYERDIYYVYIHLELMYKSNKKNTIVTFYPELELYTRFSHSKIRRILSILINRGIITRDYDKDNFMVIDLIDRYSLPRK